jgi:hypothetical protein
MADEAKRQILGPDEVRKSPKITSSAREFKLIIAGQEVILFGPYVQYEKKTGFGKYISTFKRLQETYFCYRSGEIQVLEGTNLKYKVTHKGHDYYNPIVAAIWLCFDFNREACVEFVHKILPYLAEADKYEFGPLDLPKGKASGAQNIVRALIMSHTGIFIPPMAINRPSPMAFNAPVVAPGTYLVIQKIDEYKYQMFTDNKAHGKVIINYKLPVEQYQLFISAWNQYFEPRDADESESLLYDGYYILLSDGYSDIDFLQDLAQFFTLPSVRGLK